MGLLDQAPMKSRTSVGSHARWSFEASRRIPYRTAEASVTPWVGPARRSITPSSLSLPIQSRVERKWHEQRGETQAKRRSLSAEVDNEPIGGYPASAKRSLKGATTDRLSRAAVGGE